MPYGRGAYGAAFAPVEAAMNIGSGMIAKPAGDIAGLAGIIGHKLGIGSGMVEDLQRDVQNKLTYEPRTEAGKSLATTYNPLHWIGKGVDYVGQKAEDIIAPPGAGDVMRGAGRGVHELINQAPGLLGAKIGKMAERANVAREGELATMKGENKLIDETRDAAHAAGYITPPERGLKALVSGTLGKTKPEKAISPANELNATRRLGAEVGVPPGRALSSAEFENLKRDTGKVYEKVKAAVGPDLYVTKDFRESLRGTLRDIHDEIDVNPSLAPAQRIVRAFLKRVEPEDSLAYQRPFRVMPVKTLDTQWAAKQIESLRRQAKDDYRKGNSTTGETRLGIANQLENLFEENIGSKGPQMLKEYRDARQRFAKIYLLERVTEPTGRVNLHKLGSLSENPRYKGTLTGEFKTAADFANTFGKAAQKSTGEAIPRLTVLDGLFIVGAIAHGHPGAALAEVGARAGLPAMAEMGWLQNKTPSYELGALRRGAPKMLPLAGAEISQDR
jgi:hypothetical protein